MAREAIAGESESAQAAEADAAEQKRYEQRMAKSEKCVCGVQTGQDDKKTAKKVVGAIMLEAQDDWDKAGKKCLAGKKMPLCIGERQGQM